MTIEIKISTKLIKYKDAIEYLEAKLALLKQNKGSELIWLLEHENVFTAGTNYKEEEILDKSIKIIKTNRGGKITNHGPGQLICYFLLDLNKRDKDIRKFIKLLENSIIGTLKEYKINSFSDRKNIGIWVEDHKEIKKIAAIGIRVSKWIAYHGFSININNDLTQFKKIIPCGIRDKKISNLKLINNQNYDDLKKKLIDKLINCLEK